MEHAAAPAAPKSPPIAWRAYAGLAGYAMSVPAGESLVCTGVILDHLKARGRVPEGCGLAGVFVSPWTSPELLDTPDERVVEIAYAEAERFLPGLRAATVRTFVHRFRHALPQAAPGVVRERAAFLARPPGPSSTPGTG
nr:hypothetical protein [Streptomyces sp. TLI_235]